jgi:hypothetical protein
VSTAPSEYYKKKLREEIGEEIEKNEIKGSNQGKQQNDQ